MTILDLDAELTVVESTLGVQICFHDLEGRLEPLIGSQRIQHRSRYCVAAKRQASASCTACDAFWCQRTAANVGSGFWKSCHAGVLEYYQPLYFQGQLTAAIFMGQWRWTGRDLPDFVHRDPQARLILRSPPALPELNDPDHCETVAIFARMLGARLTELISGIPSAIHADGTDTRKIRITTWITNRIMQDIGLVDLARHLGLSVPRTGHVVRECFATTFPRLLRTARLTKARNLLALTELSVPDIAKRCGFADHRYFHRCFKQAEGQPPDAWRQRQELRV